MMWDFSGGAASAQAAAYPQSQPRAIPRPPSPPYGASPGGFAISAPAAPQPFMPIGGPEDYYTPPGGYAATTYASSYSQSYAQDAGTSIPRGPPGGTTTVHIHYSRHHRHSHSHSHTHKPSGNHRSSSHSPKPHAHHSSSHSPRPPVYHSSSHSPRPTTQHHSSSKPAKIQRPLIAATQQLLPVSSSGPGRQHYFQYSKCTGRRKALCIGINYKGQENELFGCVNDARNVRRFLRNRGYKDEDIVILTDDATNPRQQPTRANMLDAMHWLVTGACSNDSLFFHYSGHGSQVKDTDGDEIDGYDEVIFPVDYKRTGHISDDLMHNILVKKLPVGCRLTALFDSCHSGSALDLPFLYSSDGRVKGSQVTDKWFEYKSTPADVISWSGCKDSQTSADTFEGGVATGAMSYAFMNSIRQNPNQTYQELLRSIRSILKKDYSQKPQLSSSHRIDTNLKFIF